MKKIAWRYHHFTHLYQKLRPDHVWFLRYGGQRTDRQTDRWTVEQEKWHTEVAAHLKKWQTEVSAPHKETTHMWRTWGTTQNFFLAFTDKLEKQIFIKKSVEVGQ